MTAFSFIIYESKRKKKDVKPEKAASDVLNQ